MAKPNYDPDEEEFANEIANEVANGTNVPYKYEPAGLPALVASAAQPVVEPAGIPAALPAAKPATMYYQGTKAEQMPGSDKYYLPTYETNSETGSNYVSGYTEIPTDQLNTTEYGHLVTPDTKYAPLDPSVLTQVPEDVWARLGISDPSNLIVTPTLTVNSETGQNIEGFNLVDPATGVTIENGNLGQLSGDLSGGLQMDSKGVLQLHSGRPEDFNLGNFISGAAKGFGEIASSDAVKYLGPMIASGGLGGAAGIGQSLGIGSIGGGAVLGAGTAALSGGDVLKGALMGGLGGAGNVAIGDTGFNVGDLTKAANLVKTIESGNLLGAITGATNLAGAGNTEIGNTGYTLNDVSKNIGLAKAIASGQPQALVGALTSVAKEQAALDTKDASKIMRDYRTAGADTSVADQAPAGEEAALTRSLAAQDPNTDQLLAAFSNPQDFSGNPSVQVAGTDSAGALEALRDAGEAGRAGGAGSGTFFDSLGRLRIADEGESEEDARAAAEAAIEAEATENVADAVNNQVATDDGTASVIDDQIAEQAPSDTSSVVDQFTQPATIEDIQKLVNPVSSESTAPLTDALAGGVLGTEQQLSVEDLIKQIESTQPTTQAVEQILASETPPAVNQIASTDLPAEFLADDTQSFDDFLKTIGINSTESTEFTDSDTTPALSGPSNQDILDAIGYTDSDSVKSDGAEVLPGTGADGYGGTGDVSGYTDPGTGDDGYGGTDAEVLDDGYGGTAPVTLPGTDDDVAEDDQAEWDTLVDPEDLNTALTEIMSPEQTDTTSLTEDDVLDFIKEHPDYEDFDKEILEQIEDPVPPDDEIKVDDDEEDDEEEDCPEGFHKDPTGLCVSDDDKEEEEVEKDEVEGCPEGFHKDPATGLCISDEDKEEEEDDGGCGEGFHKDPATGLCISDEDEEEKEEKEIEDDKSVTPKLPVTPKTPVKPKIPATDKKSTTDKTSGVNTDALKALLASLSGGQQYLPGIGDVARIKSDESLFGAIPGTSPAQDAQETQYDPVAELLAQGDEEYARGGHVDEFSVEALLQILRS